MPNDTPTKPVTKTEAQPEAHTPQHSTAGILVLQWLTYAFWGWLIIALMWLMTVVLTNAILDEPVTGMIPYAIAASVVLLPLAFFTDFFYRKHEPLKKAGGAVVIMVIHAVLFALLGIISLIVTVFTGLNIAIDTGDVDGKVIALSTAGFAALLYVATFLRTLNPFKSRKPLTIFSIFMLAITVILLIFAIAGPLAKSFATRTDRLIEQNLSSVQTGIDSYIEANNALPASLNDVTFNNADAKQLVDDGLVEYKPEAKVTELTRNGSSTEHRYQLCVEYTATSGSEYSRSNYRSINEYTSYASTTPHDAGEVCYKLKATTYDFNTGQ